MGKYYGQLSLEERTLIGLLYRDGHSQAMIGPKLGRHRSTISRELKRNSKPTKVWSGGYDASRADGLAQRRRRWDARFKMARQPHLRDHIRDLLAMGWSPEQIAGRLARDEGRKLISPESIYRYIYHRSAQKDPSWHRMLPRAKYRRGRMKRGGVSAALSIRDRISINERPAHVETREQFGHWEADLMLFSTYGQAVLIAHERKSRLLLIWRQPGKAAAPVAKRLLCQFSPLPPAMRRSITFDNGTEFAGHWRLNEDIEMATFFCDTHSPWQKGGVENGIGRLRRTLPRKTDLTKLSNSDILAHVRRYNATPRKCLDYQTPAEVFSALSKTLHFNRDSICPPTRA